MRFGTAEGGWSFDNDSLTRLHRHSFHRQRYRIGIPEDIQQLIFEPFQQRMARLVVNTAEPDSDFQQPEMRLLGGEIILESTPEQGAPLLLSARELSAGDFACARRRFG